VGLPDKSIASAAPRLGPALVAAALIFAGCGAPEPLPPPERIVLVVIDTLRRDFVSAYGAKRPTPRIDSLAESGQRFDNALSSFHMTTMTMGALFTGRTPSIESGRRRAPIRWNGRTWCGMARFGGPLDRGCIPAHLPTLGARMKQAGYATLGVQSNALLFASSGLERGFDDWQDVRGAHNAREVNKAVVRALSRRESDRFFLYVHFMDAHDYRMQEESYARGVARADAGVGTLLDLLSAQELLEGAVVVLTSDHGERRREKHPIDGLRGHQGNPSFDYLVRVPLIVSPARFDESRPVVRSEDLYGMLLDLAGLEPALDHPKTVLDPNELFLTEMGWQTYRRGDWKTMQRRSSDRSYLFNLKQDPGETRDVAGQHAVIARTHRKRMATLSALLARKRLVPKPGAAESAPESGLSEEDRERLRAVGYLE